MDDRVESAQEQRTAAERIQNLTVPTRERVGRTIHRLSADLEPRKIDTEDVARRPPSSLGWLS